VQRGAQEAATGEERWGGAQPGCRRKKWLCISYPHFLSARFIDVQARPPAFLDLTGMTLEELQQLLPPFEAAIQAHLTA